MALRERSITRLTLSRLVSVSICLCTIIFLPLPQLGVLTSVELAEGECPCQNEGEGSEEGVAVRSSSRRRLNNRRHSNLIWPHETGNWLHQIASYAGRLPTIVGPQLANGLCVPLLI